MTKLIVSDQIAKPNGIIHIKAILNSDSKLIIHSDTKLNIGTTHKIYTLKELNLRKNWTKKIKQVAKDKIDQYKQHYQRHVYLAPGETITCETKDLNHSIYIKRLNYIIGKQNISDESDKCISWYYHDIFKCINSVTVTYIRKDIPIQYTVNSYDLYDYDKLKKLASTEDFKNYKYPFMNYTHVKNLLTQL